MGCQKFKNKFFFPGDSHVGKIGQFWNLRLIYKLDIPKFQSKQFGENNGKIIFVNWGSQWKYHKNCWWCTHQAHAYPKIVDFLKTNFFSIIFTWCFLTENKAFHAHMRHIEGILRQTFQASLGLRGKYRRWGWYDRIFFRMKDNLMKFGELVHKRVDCQFQMIFPWRHT